jgi:putative nucleotidyltransferase with HDIG domain
VLRAVATRTGDAVAGAGVAGRWGGEEFLVVVHDARDAGLLRTLAEGVVQAVGGSPVDGHDVTVSVGAATDDGGGQDRLVARADLALYAAKRRGRNRACLHADVRTRDRRPEDPWVVRTAQGVALASSLRGGAPELHSQQVADLAAATAHAMGLDEPTVLRCRLAGWLHDVGATAMPDAILRKPGGLDEAEWDVMRTHAEIGAQLVARLPGLEEVAPAVRHHHERWDGAGYPDGLAGEAIVVEARIVAVADAFATITSDRTYARARPRAIAQIELLAGAGTQFDPAVVDACMEVLANWHGELARSEEAPR